MREILFRGKRVDNGEWIEGFFAKSGDKTFILIDSDIAFGYVTMKEVLSETVGQYTGLTDKNGEKIFEGDIVQGEAEEARGVVEWQQAEGRYLVSVRNGYDWLCMDDDDWCVIVNIHDNPEMLSRG